MLFLRRIGLWALLIADFVVSVVKRPFVKDISEHGFWLDGLNCGHYFDEPIAKVLSEAWQGREVIDFGCGKGRYVKYLNKAGIRCRGYDGNPKTPAFNAECQVANLAAPLDVGPVECVMSLEVGEHIPKEFEQVYLDNLTRHAKHALVLSWAVPGQPGRGHVNCQPNEYIREQLRVRGFEPDPELESRLRKAAWLHWFRNTIMAFRAKG